MRKIHHLEKKLEIVPRIIKCANVLRIDFKHCFVRNYDGAIARGAFLSPVPGSDSAASRRVTDKPWPQYNGLFFKLPDLNR